MNPPLSEQDYSSQCGSGESSTNCSGLERRETTPATAMVRDRRQLRMTMVDFARLARLRVSRRESAALLGGFSKPFESSTTANVIVKSLNKLSVLL